MTALERAESALRVEVERQVQDNGSYSGPENGSPNYVDTELDYGLLVRAVLMAVRGEAPTKAMAESQATDDEGDFAPMLDLIDFSGENKTRTVLRQAWIDGIDAILNEKDV